MAEHGDLDVLGMLASQAPEEEVDKPACHKIEEGQSHRPIVATASSLLSVQARFLNPTPAFAGQGLGERLVAGALEDLRARGLKLIPLCPFVRAYLRRHPDQADLAAGDPAIPQ